MSVVSPMPANRSGGHRQCTAFWRIALGALAATTVMAELLDDPAGVRRACAAGYALREQSASALGNAFAGATAAAQDLSYMYFNGASLTRQSGTQVAAVVSAIFPELKVRNARGVSAAGTVISGNHGGRNAAEENLVPALYGLLDLMDAFGLEQNVKVGMGVNIPFGVETNYRNGWIGRYHALESRVLAINANPVVAWEVVKGVSIAAGLQVQYVTARLTNAIDIASIGSRPGAPDGRGEVSGDDIGYGFTLGALWEPWSGTRIGASYRSSVEHDLDGDADFELGGSPAAQALSRAGLFRDTGAKARVVTPETVSLGVYHELSPQWAVLGEAEWTRWSRFRRLTVKFDNPAQPDSVTDEGWNDTWFLALGLTWKPDEAWTLRGGLAWDQDPSQDRRRTPRVPTSDRYWVALGAGWRPSPNLSFDLGYTHLFFDDANIELTRGQPGNAARGDLSGRARGGADIFAVQLDWAF